MQIGLFDGRKQFKFNKPIRLIELFGGIGCQAKALENLNIEFEHYRMCDFDKYAVQSYNAIHGTNFVPSDITKITAEDLGITETDKYCYIMTYSFPCQSLSKAGKGEGMAKGSGTRSGLLWEVERLLDECEELPQVLLMENVPDVIGTNNMPHFAEWIKKLESLGYKNYWQVLNAKDFGIPQNRERCFMVSLLGDYYYNFPEPIKLELRLKDMLEDEVDEKYYLSDKALKGKINSNFGSNNLSSILPKDGIIPTLMARDYKDPKLVQVAQLDGFESSGRWYSKEEFAPTTINTMGGGNREPKIAEPICLNSKVDGKQPSVQDRIYDSNAISTAITTGFMPSIAEPITVDTDIKQCVRKNYEREKEQIAQSDKDIYQCECENGFQDNKVGIKVSPTLRAGNSHTAVYNNYRIRKLTAKECWRLMGLSDTDFDKAKESGVSNSQLYKQAGNGIVVNVLMAIFKNLI